MQTVVKIERVGKVYCVGGEDFTALHDISLEIEAGAFLSFVGPSGSGKTTLLNLMGGLDRPTTGHIELNGLRLEAMDRKESARLRREQIGFIFQSPNLLPVYTVYENILFPMLLNGDRESRVRDRVLRIIDRVGLSAHLKKKPTQLSGGQCQRVAIARALVKDPKLVLADEPTANLDRENSFNILELMRQLNREYEAAIVISTHDEKVTRFVRREVRLEDGKILSDRPALSDQAPIAEMG
jgi:putative ABC transport system ATP-binding protein